MYYYCDTVLTGTHSKLSMFVPFVIAMNHGVLIRVYSRPRTLLYTVHVVLVKKFRLLHFYLTLIHI